MLIRFEGKAIKDHSGNKKMSTLMTIGCQVKQLEPPEKGQMEVETMDIIMITFLGRIAAQIQWVGLRTPTFCQ
jgi:hypothetical protein